MIKDIFGYLLSISRIIAFFVMVLGIIILGYSMKLFRLNTDKIILYFWSCLNLICGIKIKINGKIIKNQKTIFVSNHISYWDIPIYGQAINPTFIGKKEIKNWPIFGKLAKDFTNLYYLDRRQSQALKEKENVNKFIQNSKQNVLFFPEGTTTDGSNHLPLKGVLLENFLEKDVDVSLCKITYTKLSGKPINSKEMRRVHAWYNDIDPRYDDPNLLKSIFISLSYKSVEVHIKQLQTFNMKNIKNRKDIADKLNARMDKEFE